MSAGEGDGEFANPSGIAVDPSGNVYVADTSNARIQKFRQGLISVEPVTWTRLKDSYR